MANGGEIQYKVGFKVDKSGLNEIYKSLAKIQTLTTQDLMKGKPISAYGQVKNDLKDVQTAASAVGSALQKSFNTKINTVNIASFRKEIEQSYGSVQNLYTALNKGGYAGQQTASLLTKQLLTTNTTLHKTETLLDKMGTTFMNTIKWTLSSSVIKRITGALSEAVGYVEHLDSSLNDIRIVTKKSADEMDVFAQKANNAAKSLGKATTDYTEAALIYYQQGLKDEDVIARAETTLKAANVTGQATQTVSEELTAVWNGFKVNAEETELYVDKLAAVAAMSASNLQELSVGMSKVASAASNLGIDIDQLTAQISTIVSVTRQAPESVGTALKTIYARISDLKLGENDEDGLGLGDVSGGLKKLGIEVLDSEGELRDLGTVIEEVAGKWNTWTSAQQAAVAQLMAGKRQYNNLVALFSNWDMYENAIKTSQNATGELQKQQDIYMESTEAHLQQLKTQWEDLYDSILDADTIKGFADGLTTIVKGITTFVDSIGGGTAVLSHFVGLLGSLMSGKLAQGLNEFIGRGEQNKAYVDQLQQRLAYAKEIGKVSEGSAKHMSEYYNAWGKYAQYMSEDQIRQAEMRTKEIGDQSDLIELQKEKNRLIQEQIEEQQKAIIQAQNNLTNEKQVLQTKKENVAEEIKLMEKTMGKRNFQNPGGTGVRWTDKSANLTKTDIVSQWGQKNASVDLKNIEQDIQQVEQSAKNATAAVNSFNKSLSNYKSALKDTKKQNAFTNMATQANKAKTEVTQLYKAGEISKATFNKLANDLNKANDPKNINKVALAMQQVGQIADKTKSKISDWRKVLSEGLDPKITQQTKNAIEQATKRIDELNQKKLEGVGISKQEEQELERLKEVQNEYFMQRQATFQGILQTVMGIQQLTNSINTLGESVKSIVSGKASFGSIVSQVASLGVTGLMTFKMLKSGIDALQSSSIGFLQKVGGFLSSKTGAIIMAVVTVATTAVTIIRSIIKGGYEEAAEKANQAAEAQQKVIDSVAKEKDKVDELLKSYQEIANAREDGIHYSEDQKTAIFDLVKAYGDESLILQALSGDYEKLEESIRKARIEAEQKQQQELETGQKKYRSALIADIQNNGGITEIDDEGYDFTDAEDLTDWSNDLGKLIGSNGSIVDDSGHVKYDILAQILESDEKALYEFIEKYDGFAATDQLRKLLADNNTNLENLHKVLDEHKTVSLQLAGDEFLANSEGISTAAEFDKAVEDLYNKVADNFDSKEEGIEWAREFLQGVSDEFNNFGKTNLISDTILDKVTDKEKASQISDELNNRINNLSQSSQGFFAGNVDFIASLINQGKTVDEIFTLLEGHLESLTYEDHVVEIHTIINESDKKKLNEEIHNLFSDKNFDIGISEESFLGLDKGIQHSMLLMQQFKETEAANSLFEKDKESIIQMNKAIEDSINKENQQLQTLSKEKQELQQFINDNSDPSAISAINEEIDYFLQQKPYIMEMSDKDINELKNSYQQAMDTLSEAYEQAEKEGKDFNEVYAEIFDELPEEFQGFVSYMESFHPDFHIEDSVKQWNNYNKSIRDAKSRIEEIDKEFTNISEKISNLQHSQAQLNDEDTDYVSILGDLQTLTGELNKVVDELQTSYQDLQGVVEDYNEDGYLTLDNLQKIMEMDSSYLAALELENGQLKLNDETYGNLIQTQLHLMEVEATEQYLTELSAIAKGEVVTASQRLDAANLDNVNTINQVTNAAQQGTQALLQLAEAKAAAEVDAKATTEATQAYYNKMQLIKNIASQPTSKILGKTSSAKSSNSGSTKEPKTEKYLEREEDIYRQINKELENIESTLGRIDKVASHSWGEDYQQTLKEQNKLLDQQINKLEEKRDLQKGDLSTRRKQLEDVGVTFAEDGSVMTNAEQVLNELYAGYNAMVTKYNAMSASEQEAYKAQMETEKNRIDAIEKKIGEYESTYSEFQSTLDELLEKHYEAIENEVNQFNNKINVELELSDARKEWNDFWKDVVADVSETDFGGQIAASLKQLKELIGLGSGGQGIVGKLTTHLSKITSEVWAQINSANNGGQDSMFGDDTKLSKETLQEFISKTMSAIQDAEKEVDNIAENYLKTLESAKDIIDAQVDGYETISKHIDHNVNMIKLLDPEDYDALDRQYQRQYENDLNLVKTQRASKEFWQEQMKVHQQMRDSYAKGSKQWETYNKAYKEAVDNYVDATEAFDKAMEDALNKAKEIADNAAEAAYKRLDRSLSSNLSLEVMEDEWKLLNDEADRYYDNVERYLNMEEYTNYLNDAANAIGLSAENQEKLNAFRDTELKKLKEKEKLTEYDIEESKARLEIMKAEMALEDAQRNKSNMRLRRDSQGNYTYQYTADEEAIEDAENGVVTAKKAWYEIVKKRWKDVSQYIIDISKNIVEYQKKYREAKDRGDEEAAAKYLQLIEHQQKDLQLMYSEAAKNQQDLFSGTAQYFANVENAEILPQSEATVRTMVTQWTEGDDSFMGAIQNGIDEINRIQQQYVDDTQKVFEEAGESYEGLRDNGIDPTKDSLDALVESQGDLDDNLNQITEDLRDHSEALDDAVRGYEDLKDAAVNAIAEANRALETLAATAIDAKTKVNEAVTASQTAPGIGYNQGASNNSSNSGNSGNNTSLSTGPALNSNTGKYTVNASDRNGFQLNGYPIFVNDKGSAKVEARRILSKRQNYTVTINGPEGLLSLRGNTPAESDRYISAEEERKLKAYKTGGYTGSWGSTGKLAVLHEKELVLNSSDTKNLLSAIEILRSLPFSALAKSIVDSSSNIASTFRSGVSMNGVNGAITNNDTKNMTINADFSGVQSADEIYQALIELENYGLQQSYSVAPNINNPY